MTTTLSFVIGSSSLPEPALTPYSAPVPGASPTSMSRLLLGSGVVRPFRRDAKGDFANAAEVDLVRAAVAQVLATIARSDFSHGELPWRPEFGSLANLMRMQNNDEVLAELGRVYVIDALRFWEPRISLRDAQISKRSVEGGQDNGLEIFVAYDIVSRQSGTAVVVPNVTQVVEV